MSTRHHDLIAARLLAQAAEALDPAAAAALVARAHAHATLAVAEQSAIRNLIHVLEHHEHLEHDDAHTLIRRQIRHRLGLFPPLHDEGQAPNGGAHSGD